MASTQVNYAPYPKVDAKKVDLIKDEVNYFRHLVDVLDNVKITVTFLT